jgi:hypothetical protein
LRLINWLQYQVVEFREAHPEVKKFKLHNFRWTAMSRARMAGIRHDDAAVAFGCNSQTMRQHYIALDEVEICDRVVMERIQCWWRRNWGPVSRSQVAAPRVAESRRMGARWGKRLEECEQVD